MKSNFFLLMALSAFVFFTACQGESEKVGDLEDKLSMQDSMMKVHADSISELNHIIDSLMALVPAKRSSKSVSSGSTGSGSSSGGSTIQNRKEQMKSGGGDINIGDRKQQMQSGDKVQGKTIDISDRKKQMLEKAKQGQ